MAALSRLLAMLVAPAALAAQAQLLTFTETSRETNEIPLGYPVPMPVDSLTPVDGFRSYAALRARLAALDTDSTDITEVEIGRTVGDRPIHAYRIGDADTTTTEGFAEPAALINGGIHAREWASPEVVAGLVERFAQRRGDGGFYRYLLDNLSLVVIPVLNVDGFLHTQRHPTQTLQTEYAGDAIPAGVPAEYRNYPRDGRMRRKNLRDVDENLCPAVHSGCMNGVDLNRNSDSRFFDSGNQNSDDVGSLLYHGAFGGSEPETQALYAAADLAPRARLRFYADTHSFSRVFFGVDTGVRRRDTLARRLAERMSAATTGDAGRYPYDPSPPDYGIGSTDEYFGFGLQIPSYTLEIEPQSDSAREGYGGYGYHHDGFILPDAQIARVRAELADAYGLGLYRIAGPPVLLSAQIRRADDGRIVYAARWQRSGAARRLQVDTREALQAEVDYRLWLGFDKPMRVRDAAGAVTQYRGQNAPLAPAIAVEGLDRTGAAFRFDLQTTADGWLEGGDGAPDGRLRYADDAYALDFRLPASLPLADARRANLRVDVQDLSGQALDADPATVLDWAAGWSGYEDEQGRDDTDSGGADRTQVLVGDGDSGSGGGGGGALGHAALLALSLLGLSRVRQRIPSSR
ncbi:M14 family metallopeptidase [Fontimonas sp. SYSU GA230001]|uniref:M14 family metallopeptidase n=1 Tax=Fontimonas sp. SYSU GA230001 TaxID=3142450 RepID=UPI0032B55520